MIPSDGGLAGIPDLVFAVSVTDYGSPSSDAGPAQAIDFGFDLDHTCTGLSRCVEPPGAGLPAYLHRGLDGIDNAFTLIVGGVLPQTIPASPYATEVLFRLHGYNGQRDQDPVDVSLYLALGLSARDDGGVGPFWDGQDRWTILPEVLAAPDGVPNVEQPLFHADRAYVTGGVLVAEFDRALWPTELTNVPRFLVTARQLTIAGRLVLVPAGDAGIALELRNIRTGLRVGMTDSLKALGYTPIDPALAIAPPDGGPRMLICQDLPTYGADKQVLCGTADVTADPSAPPTATCDAVSVGLLFQAAQAQLGGVAEAAPELPPCEAGVGYSCDSVGDP